MKILYRISLSYACGGIIIEDSFVKKTAPIFSWMINKDLNFIQNWVHKKKGTIMRVNTNN